MAIKILLLEQFKPFREKFNQLDFEPLKITIELYEGSSILQYNPIYIDALLQSVVAQQAMQGKELMTDSKTAYDIPIPIKKEWVMPSSSLPLYASTCLFPTDDFIEGTVYYHKRAHSGKFSRGKRGKKQPLKIVTIMGPDMERRIPTPTLTTSNLSGFCIGNKEEVEKLLSCVRVLGKRRNLGNNTLKSISVESVNKFSFFSDRGILMRSIPTQYAVKNGLELECNPSVLAWTPPYWKPSLFSEGYRTGDKSTKAKL